MTQAGGATANMRGATMRIIDLTMPIITDHVRWKAERTVAGDVTRGDLFQVTSLKVSCHSFTHVDARRHYFADGPTVEATPLEDVVGEAAVIDLMDVEPNEAVAPERLAPRCGHVRPGDRILFKSGWDTKRSFRTQEFWLDAPYLTREAAQFLKDKAVRTVAYDFPQDYAIRLLLKGEVRPIEEHVTHDILLRSAVHMIEYVVNTAELRAERVWLSAAPLKIPGADGAPARVYAVEGR
jgi:arylformamidase